jgi:hypothetical protein
MAPMSIGSRNRFLVIRPISGSFPVIPFLLIAVDSTFFGSDPIKPAGAVSARRSTRDGYVRVNPVAMAPPYEIFIVLRLNPILHSCTYH